VSWLASLVRRPTKLSQPGCRWRKSCSPRRVMSLGDALIDRAGAWRYSEGHGTIPQEKEHTMAKTLRCGDLMPGCPTVIEGKDEQEVLKKAAEHAARDHGLAEIPPEVAQKVQAAIRDK